MASVQRINTIVCWQLIIAFSCCSTNNDGSRTSLSGLSLKGDTISYRFILGDTVCNGLKIEKDVDLGGRLCLLPKGARLCFKKGVIKNGVLVGNGTKLEHKGICFDKVSISGTWDVERISTAMFRDLNYDNSLKDVVALANPNVKNRIIIEEGEYQVSADKNHDVCIPICSNTELVLNGTIKLTPNSYTNCYIIQTTGENIIIKGQGSIVGDKYTHTGILGEWGMGISLRQTCNARISGLTIRECWGDCIYVDDETSDVLIEDCCLVHGRRQGVSVVSGDRVTIRNCRISNVGGTNPEYAIDVEPDQGKKVGDVKIENVTVRDCKGGFVVYGRAADAKVGKVTIRNCDVSADKKITIGADKCDTLIVEDCDITQHNTWGCVTCTEVGHVEIRNNTLHYDKGLMARLKDWMRPKFGKKRVKVMEIDGCKSSSIENNREQNL